MEDRIKLEMNTFDVIKVMGGGNPGALMVCARLLKEGGAIDPDDAFQGLGSLLMLDTLRIYEHRIWMLYKDVCGEKLDRVIALLRADQMGQLSGVTGAKLNRAIDHHGEGIDVEAALVAVKNRLPNFGQVQSHA